jgi:hypothetical protein
LAGKEHHRLRLEDTSLTYVTPGQLDEIKRSGHASTVSGMDDDGVVWITYKIPGTMTTVTHPFATYAKIKVEREPTPKLTDPINRSHRRALAARQRRKKK